MSIWVIMIKDYQNKNHFIYSKGFKNYQAAIKEIHKMTKDNCCQNESEYIINDIDAEKSYEIKTIII